jgi:hypothetical protein
MIFVRFMSFRFVEFEFALRTVPDIFDCHIELSRLAQIGIDSGGGATRFSCHLQLNRR